MTNITHVILARGGSKGIPRKNLRCISGYSLLERAIIALRNAEQKNILVSSDDPEILQIARKQNCELHRRSELLSSDTASSEEALLACLEETNTTSTYVSLVQCTNAFWVNSEIEKCIDTILNENCDSTFAATKFNHFVWTTNSNNNLQSTEKDEPRRRRQDLKDNRVLELGSIYIMNRLIFQRERNRFCGTCMPSIIDKKIHLEIDDENDLLMANQVSGCLSKRNDGAF